MTSYHICIADIPSIIPEVRCVGIDTSHHTNVYLVENLLHTDVTALTLAGYFVLDINTLYLGNNNIDQYLPHPVRVAYQALTI